MASEDECTVVEPTDKNSTVVELGNSKAWNANGISLAAAQATDSEFPDGGLRAWGTVFGVKVLSTKELGLISHPGFHA
jgi:hypothetical protein